MSATSQVNNHPWIQVGTAYITEVLLTLVEVTVAAIMLEVRMTCLRSWMKYPRIITSKQQLDTSTSFHMNWRWTICWHHLYIHQWFHRLLQLQQKSQSKSLQYIPVPRPVQYITRWLLSHSIGHSHSIRNMSLMRWSRLNKAISETWLTLLMCV